MSPAHNPRVVGLFIVGFFEKPRATTHPGNPLVVSWASHGLLIPDGQEETIVDSMPGGYNDPFTEINYRPIIWAGFSGFSVFDPVEVPH